jgi:hypothetical protein
LPSGLERGGFNANPPYLSKHSGPVLVVGNAWCLADDLARARALFPDAPCIAINGAAAEVKALALYTWHPDRLAARPFAWIEKQRALFGGGFTVHGARPYPEMPWVEHWWHCTKKGGGGSAWGARKMAWLMGFAPVVLVGCPLVPGPYVNGSGIGGWMTKDHIVQDLVDQIAADKDWHQGACSMSGETKRILGEPNG